MENKQNTNENKKTTWEHCIPVKVSKVVVELDKDQVTLNRVRLETDLGNITYKPKLKIISTLEDRDFFAETTESERLKLAKFKQDYPLIVLLAKNCKKKPQDIILSYAEFENLDEKENPEHIRYKFMNKKLFETIYYEEFHKKDKSNLQKMEEFKNKYGVELAEDMEPNASQ